VGGGVGGGGAVAGWIPASPEKARWVVALPLELACDFFAEPLRRGKAPVGVGLGGLAGMFTPL